MKVCIYEPLVDRLCTLSARGDDTSVALVGFISEEKSSSGKTEECDSIVHVLDCFIMLNEHGDNDMIQHMMPGGVSVVGMAGFCEEPGDVDSVMSRASSSTQHLAVCGVISRRDGDSNVTLYSCHKEEYFDGENSGEFCAVEVPYTTMSREQLLDKVVIVSASGSVDLQAAVDACDDDDSDVEYFSSSAGVLPSQLYFVDRQRALVLRASCDDDEDDEQTTSSLPQQIPEGSTCDLLLDKTSRRVNTTITTQTVATINTDCHLIMLHQSSCADVTSPSRSLSVRHTQSAGHSTMSHDRYRVSLQCVAVLDRTAPLCDAGSELYDSMRRQLAQYRRVIGKYRDSASTAPPSDVRLCHYWPSECGVCFSSVYCDGGDSDGDRLSSIQRAEVRQKIHRSLLLSEDRPLFRAANSLPLCPRSSTPPSHHDAAVFLCDVHVGLSPPPLSTVAACQTALVRGHYTYYHYMQHGLDDSGWGCAYRSLQTLASWFCWQGYVERDVASSSVDQSVPSHRQIQQCLVDLGDKPASFVNSRQWIGSTEVGFCLDSLLHVQYRQLHVTSGADMALHARELVRHFSEHGTPVMIGGGVLAHTLLGVCFDPASGDAHFLVLDPHYTGDENLATVQKKGWCGWKPVSFWDQTAYYNLCMPLRPRCL